MIKITEFSALSVCYVPGTTLTLTLWCLCFFYSHFTDKETKTQVFRDLPNISQLVSYTVNFKQEQFASKVHSVTVGYYTILSQYLTVFYKTSYSLPIDGHRNTAKGKKRFSFIESKNSGSATRQFTIIIKI